VKEILEDLARKIGARGALVITKDGITIASVASEDLHEDRVAALTQRTVDEMRRATDEVGLPGFERMILTADCGRLVLFDVSIAYLVVVTQIGVVVEQIMLEIESAARRIERAGRIAV